MMAPSLETHGGNVWEAARRLSTKPAEMIDFSASINPIGPSPRALSAFLEASRGISAYPDPDCMELAEEIAAYHRIPVESILVGNGSTELIYLVARAYGKRTLIPVPSFSDYERSVRITGGLYRFLKAPAASGFRIELDRLDRSLRKGPTLLFLGNPNNPTGQRHSPERLLSLVERAGRLRIQAALDEAFIDFWEEASLVREAPRLRHLIVLRSFTKFFALAGLRVGYLVAHPATIKQLRALKEPWTVNTPAQAAARASLSDRSYIEESRKRMEETRGDFMTALQAHPGLKVYPSDANFVLVRLPSRRAAITLAERLMERRILIRNAGSFRGLEPKHVRLAVRRPEENRLLLEALKEVAGRKKSGS
jgi:threonine-phosphate decarboxylase